MLLLCSCVPCNCLCLLLVGFCVSFYFFYTYIENYSTEHQSEHNRTDIVAAANRAKRNDDDCSSSIFVGLGELPADGNPGFDLQYFERPAPNGDETVETVCSYALCAMVLCMFVICNVFPEYCCRQRIHLEKHQHLINEKSCGCIIMYTKVRHCAVVNPREAYCCYATEDAPHGDARRSVVQRLWCCVMRRLRNSPEPKQRGLEYCV